ncbi:hypothetical protein R6Q59_029704 [Mikania micrantha]
MSIYFFQDLTILEQSLYPHNRSPGNSKSRYLGIWFKNTSPQTIVWVANRETPVTDNLGAVKLDNQGNLTLVDGSGKVIWSSNCSASGASINLVAQLLDTGNLVACKNNCSCTAYANPIITPGGVGCLLWFGDLIDVRVFPQNGQDLYVRLAASELSGNSTNQMRSAEVPLFSLSKICRATNDFSNDNKLGEGGFRPVYKGVLEEGQEIAVKRLSKSSRQGLDEFKNEVICIAKLQHRNLVKLLGYCIQGDEKMLIYEYMPNKSLDYFLFDESRKSLLDWPQRFQIIQGIARGVLYLHQDSRLKVVHRDLKAGNILLDHQMFPKIADFGLARMFRENESEANTKRVVGTLGYISPEYAVNGLFSLNGKKNRGFVHEDHEDNLLGHAWRLFKKGKSLDLIDECLHVSYSACEVSRSIHVGLLCVQQRVEDRPNTPTVVGMLGGEGSLPSPKKPAFYIQESEINSASNLSLLPSSVNELTLSQVDGR